MIRKYWQSLGVWKTKDIYQRGKEQGSSQSSRGDEKDRVKILKGDK